MNRLLLSLVLVVWTSGCGTTLPEKRPVLDAPAHLDLPPFQVHTLDNGLRLVTVENHAHPIIGLTGYVTTGGRTESEHYAGALHFIEHLVFKGGTKRFPPTAFRKRIAALGDENGGWTWDDEIQFGFEVPKLNFGTALDVFAESLLELQWSERWFEDERKVVLQEIEKVSERPWHRLWAAWDELAFTRHPYRRAVIGDSDTIRAQTMEELERYYKQRFTPNHLILIVVGDFDTPRMVKRIGARFGRYQRGPASFELPDVAEPEQLKPRRTRVEYKGTRNTRFLTGFRTPGAAHKDTPALLLLAQLLASPTEGLSAYLTRKKQWVTTVDVEYSFMVDYGHLTVQGECDTANAATVLKWLNEYLTSLSVRPFSDAAVREAARELLTARARSWETFGEQAQGLGFWIERMGEQASRQATEQLLAQTPEMLAALARKYLTEARYVEAVMTPPGAKFGAAATIDERNPSPAVPNLKVPGLLRSSPAAPWKYGETGRSGDVVRYTYESGLTLLVRPTDANGLLSVVAHVAGGQWVEPKAQAGVAVLTGRLLTSGTKHLSVSQWDRILSSAAVSHSTELRFSERSNVPRNVHSRDGTAFALSGTADQTETLLALTGEALFRPHFPQPEVVKARRVLINEIESLAEDNLEFIKQGFYQLVFPDHPYGRPTIGDKTTVSRLTRADVTAFHKANYAADRITVTVTGRVEPSKVAELIAQRWSDAPDTKAGPLPPVVTPAPRPVPERRQVLERGKDQWCLNIGFPTLSATDGDFAGLELLLAIARGRHFYKYVYEIGTSYRSWIKLWPHRSPSVWIVENDIAKGGFDDTVKRIHADLMSYARGVFSKEDVELSRTRLLNRTILDAQNGMLTAFELARAIGLGLSFDYQQKRIQALKAATVEDVNRLARQVFGNPETYELITK